MLKVSDITAELERLAPRSLAEKWDNVGLMVGSFNKQVKNIFVCLDITSENVEQAAAFGADLIISHHPLIFHPLRRVVEEDVIGGIVNALIKNDISAYSMHTNFDNADGGMNDILAEKLGLCEIRRFTDKECVDELGEPFENCGRVGKLPYSMRLEDFVNKVQNTLSCSSIKYRGDGSDVVRTVAVASGSGGDFLYAAYHSDADVFVTADVKHDCVQRAQELGMNLIDAGHFETENIICEFLHRFLTERFSDINVKISGAIPYFG